MQDVTQQNAMNQCVQPAEYTISTNEGGRVVDILGTDYPLIQAPMNWVTNAQFVAAVSNAGALGMLGPNAGQHEHHPSTMTYEKTMDEIVKTQALTAKPFGINILTPMNRYAEETLAAALDGGIRYFTTVGDVQPEVFRKIKDKNGIIIHRPLDADVDNMRHAESLGADLLVATGYDEGGIIPEQHIGTFTIVPAMVDAVDIPVLAAGGINDHRGVMAAFALGASGVYVGSRFLVTQESPLPDSVKAAILSASNHDMILVAKQQRSLDTVLAKDLAAYYTETGKSDKTAQVLRDIGGVRPGMLEGDLDNGIVSLNTGIGIIRDIPTVQELIHRLMEGKGV